MTAKEAYKIIINKNPTMYTRSCLDFGSFFAFCLAPIYIPEDEDYLAGTVLDAVEKRTGRVFEHDFMSDMSLFDRAKSIDVKTLV